MSFEYLDKESEMLLTKLLVENDICGRQIQGSVIEHLIENGYVKGNLVSTLSSNVPAYVITEITQKGKSYSELKKLYIEEQKKISRREWKIAIIGTLIGTLLGLIPTLLQHYR